MKNMVQSIYQKMTIDQNSKKFDLITFYKIRYLGTMKFIMNYIFLYNINVNVKISINFCENSFKIHVIYSNYIPFII